VTNTVEDQVWQSGGLNVDSFDFSSNMEPTYRVKIEGRLLDDEDDLDKDETNDEPRPEDADGADKMEEDGDAKSKAAKPPKYRFSHFFKALTVEFPASRKGVDQPVEWKKPERAGPSTNLPAAADFDELTFKRSGDENMNIVINLYRHEEPERYALTPELEDIVDKPEATRQELIMAIWDYIKFHGLQEDEDKRNFRCDETLRKVLSILERRHSSTILTFKKAFKTEVAQIPLLNTLITPLLSPLPPVKVAYTIRVDEDFHKDAQPTVYDIRVAVDDPLREKMLSFLNNSKYASMLKDVATLDEQLALVIQALEVSKAKHGFLESLAENPTAFVKQWLSSQQRDLDVIMGEAVRGSRGDATGDEWRKGGKDGVWGSVNAKESVSVLLSKQPAPAPR
jgi:SWI/SNF-related matrix-associated actin-dependent regulator of chromatin subfamily D